MPRVAAAALPFLNVRGDSPRLLPSADLDEAVADKFLAHVNAVPPEHLRESDRAVLVELCRAEVVSDMAWDKLQSQGFIVGDKPSPWLRVHREQQKLIATLATRCRLTAQSRISKERAGNTNNRGGGMNLAAGMAHLRAKGNQC